MGNLRKLITAFICFFFPNRFAFWILNILGHKIHHSARIGFSIIWLNGVFEMEKDSKIGHLNLIRINSLQIFQGAYIGKMNRIKGPIDVFLSVTAAIGNNNSIYRAPLGVTYNTSVLKLGILSKITANHRVDCTRSVVIGDYSTIAGHDSQLWTHAYYHDSSGPGRFRLDGEIEIGNNVYVGSRCIINVGVKIADAVVIGANSCISKSLMERGTYVSQPLRHIKTEEGSDQRSKFRKIEGYKISDEVYERRN